jgi:diacylglycerol kinase (ATP)
MRISLLYNASAGVGVSSEELRSLVESCDHEVIHVVEKDDDLEEALDGAVELVVAAGGDGTVSRAAGMLAGKDVPFAVLPLGTANNIAKSLGLVGSLRDMIGRWRRAGVKTLDLGILRGSWGESWFIEGAGAGLVPSGIVTMEGEPDPDGESLDARLNRARQRYLEVVERLKPREWSLTIDGTPVEGRFLLVEALNMRSVGPNLEFGRRVDPSDGRLSLVIAKEEHRQAVADYLRDLIAGHAGRLRLPTWQARHIDIDGLDEMHVDDEVRHWPSMGPVSIDVEPAAVRILV